MIGYINGNEMDFLIVKKCIRHMEDNFSETIFCCGANLAVNQKLYDLLCSEEEYSKKTFIAITCCIGNDTKILYCFQKVLEDLSLQLLMLDNDCFMKWQLLLRKEIGNQLNDLINFVPLAQYLVEDVVLSQKNFTINRSSCESIIKKFLRCFQKQNYSLILCFKDAHKADYETAGFIDHIITDFKYNQSLIIVSSPKSEMEFPLTNWLNCNRMHETEGTTSSNYISLVKNRAPLETCINHMIVEFSLNRFSVYYNNQKNFICLIDNSKIENSNYPIGQFRACFRSGLPIIYDSNIKHIYKDESYYSCNNVKNSCTFPVWQNMQMKGVIYIEYGEINKTDTDKLLEYLELTSYKIISSIKWMTMTKQSQDYNSSILQKKLTEREKEVVKYTIMGKTNKEIAKLLWISENTVKTHLKSIYKKLKINKRIELPILLKNSSFLFETDELSP